MHYEIKKIVGIDVIFAPMHDASSVTIEILVKAGSLYETAATNGLSHFLEHMFFKGGKSYPTAKIVAETMDELGGDYNAFTGNNYAGYYVKSAPAYIHKALSVLGDMMVYPLFPAEEIEKEKGVVIQEIKMYDDRPDAKVAEVWNRNYYGDNSHGWSILGPEDNILSFTQDNLFAHKNSLYTKDNMVITIAGKIIDEKALIQQLEDLFSSLPEKMTYDQPSYTATHPHNTRDIISQGTHQNHLVYGGPGLSHDHKHLYTAKILGKIVGGGMSSRLFQEIREKRGLCYYIHAGHRAKPDHGLFSIGAGLSKENYTKGVDAIKEILTTTASGDITQAELDKAQSSIIGSLQMGIETSDQMTDFIGSQYLLYHDIKTIDDLLSSYQAVTLSDIHEISPMLHPDNFYGCTID